MAVRPLHTRVVFWLLSACLGLVLWTYLSTPARPSASSSSSVAPVLAHDGRTPISYDLTSPPTADPCYDIIYDGQRRLVEAYRYSPRSLRLPSLSLTGPPWLSFSLFFFSLPFFHPISPSLSWSSRELLKGITHVFILGHLGTENKGAFIDSFFPGLPFEVGSPPASPRSLLSSRRLCHLGRTAGPPGPPRQSRPLVYKRPDP